MILVARRLSENAHLRRYPHPSSLQRTSVYALFLGIPDALHLYIFHQPLEIGFSDRLVEMVKIGRLLSQPRRFVAKVNNSGLL